MLIDLLNPNLIDQIWTQLRFEVERWTIICYKEEPKFPIEGTKNAPVMDIGRGAGLPTGSAKLKFFRQKYIFLPKF